MEKKLRWPCRSREKDADFATRPAKQINKIMQLWAQNIKTVYTSREKQKQSSYTYDKISDI